MNGCRNASAGVHRLSEFMERQRSSRSTKAFNSLISPSFMPFTLAINLVLRSRVGLEKLMIRTTSFCKGQLSDCRTYQGSGESTYLSRQFVLFHTSEVQKIIKVKGGELSFSEYLVAELASALHDCTQHLVVASSSEQNLPSIKLEKSTSN